MESEFNPTHMSFRLDAVEKQQQAAAKDFCEFKVSNGLQLGALSTEISGIREQAKAHNQQQEKAIGDLKVQMGDSSLTTQKLVTASSAEVQALLDRVVISLGIDEDPKAAKELNKDLQFLKNRRIGMQNITSRAVNAATVVIVGAFFMALYAGIQSYSHAH